MALDQFLIEIEETFGVDLMAPGADEVLTLEELITYLEKFTAEMPHTQDEVDRLIQDNIDKLRTIIASSLGIDGTNISPKAELESILKPRSVRRRIWSKMRQEFSEYIPPLTSKVYRILGCAVCIPLGIFIAWSVVIGQNPENPNPMPIALLLGILAGTILPLSLYIGGTIVFASLFSTYPFTHLERELC